ncbi:hypothetical protein E3N88_22923 [Mikania micrantha]|uniref:Serine-threonine/tyrosine-protein kinase catalytic domain-containing protein n=1 Tax=Mikania micrantha TaxID=192012 RepID=A0A5N6NBV3_9ASTR|nr:hypothetical protein E3N88_22923 [Mikania micrantha]
MAFATGKESAPSTSSTQPSVSCRHFEFPEILIATENFSDLDEEQWGLVTWVQDSIKEGNLKNIIDLDIRGEISPKCLKEYVKLAERCLHNSPKHRPTMAEILFSLESVMAIQEKSNNSLQSANRTLFGRIVNLFPFISNQENSGTFNSFSISITGWPLISVLYVVMTRILGFLCSEMLD